MDKTTLLELDKPVSAESFSRSVINGNMDLIDQDLVAFAFMGVPYAAYTKAAMVFDANGNPQSQVIAGPNGLTGSIIWSFTATTITQTLAITAPVAYSVVNTINLVDLSESTTVS